MSKFTVQKIKSITPIDGFDKIVRLDVNGNQLFSSINNGFKENDLVLFFEIDAFIPCYPQFEWLRKSSYVKLADGKEGFRLQQGKIKNITSDGLALPLSVLNEFPNFGSLVVYEGDHDVFMLCDQRTCTTLKEGADLSGIFGVTEFPLELQEN